jgi:hypothetical protein
VDLLHEIAVMDAFVGERLLEVFPGFATGLSSFTRSSGTGFAARAALSMCTRSSARRATSASSRGKG